MRKKIEAAKQFFKGFSKAFEGPQHGGKVATIGAVKPNVPKTKKEKALSKLAIAKQKTKGSAAKLKQTLFNLKEDRKKLNLRENKMGGGMMGRRMGYSQGKLAVTPREKQLAAQYGDKKRITRGDVITAAKKKGAKNGKTMS